MRLTVPHVQRRLMHEQLDELITWLETDDERPTLFGSRDEYQWLLRLTATVIGLVARHKVDGHGRCQWCHQPRHGWRRLLPRWSQRAPCRVLRTATLFAESDIELVWCQVFGLRGEDITLDEIRTWLRPDEPAEDESVADPAHRWRSGDNKTDAEARPKIDDP